MYQSESSRFQRTKSSDMIVTFLPVLLVFSLRSILRTMDIPRYTFVIAQVLMALFLIVVFVLTYRFYFRTFRCTVIDRDSKRKSAFPAGSLTFERLMGSKTRIYERVMAQEAFCLLEPGQIYDEARFGAPFKTYVLTVMPRSSAYRIYYCQEGAVYCALFHPNPQQAAVLRGWTETAA